MNSLYAILIFTYAVLSAFYFSTGIDNAHTDIKGQLRDKRLTLGRIIFFSYFIGYAVFKVLSFRIGRE